MSRVGSEYGIQVVVDNLGSNADIDLQEELFYFAGLNLEPQDGLVRYWIAKVMIDKLEVTHDKSDEKILGHFDDYCNACPKIANVFSKAKVEGLLVSRLEHGQLNIAADKPLTNGEFVTFIVRYLNRKNIN